jgi:hypothetical protein
MARPAMRMELPTSTIRVGTARRVEVRFRHVVDVRENGALQVAVKRALVLATANLVLAMSLLLLTVLLCLTLYATKIGLALVFVGPVAVRQARAVQYVLKKREIKF